MEVYLIVSVFKDIQDLWFSDTAKVQLYGLQEVQSGVPHWPWEMHAGRAVSITD